MGKKAKTEKTPKTSAKDAATEMDEPKVTTESTTPVQDDSMESSSSAALKNKTLYVGNLPHTMNNEQFAALLSELGPLKWSFVVRTANNPNENRGFGYVQFALESDAQEAGKQLNQLKYQGKQLMAKVALPKKHEQQDQMNKDRGKDDKFFGTAAKSTSTSTTPSASVPKKPPTEKMKLQYARVIVRNVPFSAKEDTLRNLFEKYGAILEVSLPKKSPEALHHRGFAFVQFADRENAMEATNALNATKLLNRTIIVDLAMPQDQYEDAIKNQLLPAENYDDIQPSETKVDEDEEEDSNDDDGEVDDDDDDDEKEGTSDEEGEEVEEVDEEKGQEMKESKKGKEQKKKMVLSDADEGLTVFVRNVPVNATEEEVSDRFKEFGEIQYCKVVRDPITNFGKGTAFVKYKDPDSVEKCLQEGEKASLTVASRRSDSLIQDEASEGIFLGGRLLFVFRAVSKNESQVFAEKKLKVKEKDTRNLYLAEEGVIKPNTPAAADLTPADLQKRAKAQQEKKVKLRNPNFFVSKTRLSLRNLPLSCDETKLKEIAINAVKARLANNEEEKKMSGATAAIRIHQVKIIRSKDRQNRSTGFGFLEFKEHTHALMALRHINNNPQIFGPSRRPIVEFAIENALILQKRNERGTSKRKRNDDDEENIENEGNSKFKTGGLGHKKKKQKKEKMEPENLTTRQKKRRREKANKQKRQTSSK